jgi:enamine deaminase RidA (YjgF/YER057c/UK114 family)
MERKDIEDITGLKSDVKHILEDLKEVKETMNDMKTQVEVVVKMEYVHKSDQAWFNARMEQWQRENMSKFGQFVEFLKNTGWLLMMIVLGILVGINLFDLIR